MTCQIALKCTSLESEFILNVIDLLMKFLYFSVTHDINTSASDNNIESKLISNLAFQWKMSFSQDPNKEAQGIIS